MTRRPSDILDFLRNSGSDEPAQPEAPRRPVPGREVEKTPQVLILRRSQVVVAVASAALLVLLAFVLGLAIGGDGTSPARPRLGTVWGIRVITFDASQKGTEQAQEMVQRLQALDIEEVTIQPIPSTGKLVVMLGSWLTPPDDSVGARATLTKVKKLTWRGKQAFPDADFWSVQR
ncbi:MAG: hypothetical protein ACYTGN_03265 [Planctomycetota bacterium]|jgi:hypothetical protein